MKRVKKLFGSGTKPARRGDGTEDDDDDDNFDGGVGGATADQQQQQQEAEDFGDSGTNNHNTPSSASTSQAQPQQQQNGGIPKQIIQQTRKSSVEFSSILESTDAPTVVKSYDAVPLLEQTKLPRGGVSMDTEAVGRVQVCVTSSFIKHQPSVHCKFRISPLLLSLIISPLPFLFFIYVFNSSVFRRKPSKTVCD